MRRWELSETLLGLVEAVWPPEGSGLIVTEADLEVPLEISIGVRRGSLVFSGMPPHTRWKSGLLPPVHMSRLHVVLLESEGRSVEGAGGG